MTRRNANAAAGETTRIRLPLFWSAAAHFLAISALLLLGTRSGAVSFRGIVDVFLVGGTDGERGAEKRAVRDESAGGLRTPGVPSGTPAVPPSAPFPSPRAQGTTAGEEGRRAPARPPPSRPPTGGLRRPPRGRRSRPRKFPGPRPPRCVRRNGVLPEEETCPIREAGARGRPSCAKGSSPGSSIPRRP